MADNSIEFARRESPSKMSVDCPVMVAAEMPVFPNEVRVWSMRVVLVVRDTYGSVRDCMISDSICDSIRSIFSAVARATSCGDSVGGDLVVGPRRVLDDEPDWLRLRAFESSDRAASDDALRRASGSFAFFFPNNPDNATPTPASRIGRRV